LYYWFFILFFLDENRRVFLYENCAWNIKGRYETAMEDDDYAAWTNEGGEHLLQILFVSIIL
jgi:hypothetical protein